MIAARTEHVLKVLKPALMRDAIVICDRFSDSTLVYQGLPGHDAGFCGPCIICSIYALIDIYSRRVSRAGTPARKISS